MAKIHISTSQVIRLRLGEGRSEVPARVLSQNDEAIVVELLQEVPGFTPGTAQMAFVADQFFMRAPVNLLGAFQNWWFVERPEQELCEPVQRRTFDRIFFDGSAVVMPVTATGEPDGELTTLTLANLSADGCLGHCEADMEVGDYLLIFLTLPDIPTTSVISRVVRVKKEEDGGGWYGVRFEGITSTFQEDLARFVPQEIDSNLALGRDITQPVS
jgi:hypothetical protein